MPSEQELGGQELALRTGVGRARVGPQDRSWEGKSWPSGQELGGQELTLRTGVGRARVGPQDRSWEGKGWEG